MLPYSGLAQSWAVSGLRPKSPLLVFGIPVVAVAGATLLTGLLYPILTPGRFLLFVAAVAISAWAGGRPAGLLATGLGALGHVNLLLFPLQTVDRVNRSDWLGLVLFIPVSLVLTWTIESLHAARRLERRLRQLEVRVEEELRRRIEGLAEKDEHKDEFLAVVAHELRNRINPVCHALHVLRATEGDLTSKIAWEVANRQMSHMTRLIDDLQDTSRILHGRLLLRRERIDLVRIVREAAEDHRADLEAAHLTLRLEVPGEPVQVRADATRLTQVVGNLLNNAVKFTNPGGTVFVRLGSDPVQGRALVTVRDTGIGIESHLLSSVFDAFTQAERSLERSRNGLGLGLSLVKALVELHGGGVSASSDGPGRGATFGFWLPLWSGSIEASHKCH
jgi:signal transduction histidine kinase